MSEVDDDAVADALRSLLGQGSSLLPFAQAVVVQVAGHTASERRQAEVVEKTVRVLQAATAGHDPAIEEMVTDPKLLASFFQNADLLDTAGSEGAAVAELVMEALGRIWEEPE